MSLVERYDCFLLDLDGVLFRGEEALPGAAEAVDAVRGAGRRLVFVTNNSSRTPRQVADKLVGLGIRAEPGEVVSSALATADLLAARGGGTAFVIGELGIREALTEAGLSLLSGEPASCDYVVVGWDRGVDYPKLKSAALLVQRGARLVATNSDPAYPAPDGLWPGAGALLAAITTATGAHAEVVGKPNASLFRAALERGGGGRPLVVGDRLDTDIAGAAGMGWDSLLVLTGISTREEINDGSIRPTYISHDLRGLISDEALVAMGHG